eukprot:TRINITY_DN113470_c0_g1_i1.p1 TRINITY_DN113470_c0_g1~~TRINITY_DN113470_c0_g1_i1.p1  ORF type:complete len:539 (+),score=80.80 TRINITY_DN113470_c0_g1_i1:132-1619(+)
MGELSLWAIALGEHCDANGESIWGVVLYPFIMLYCFYILAQICDGHLTTALEFIVERLKMSEDVAGATFLAMASSAPELFCSIVATFVLVSASGVGNIVGSALFNLLVIIGVTPIFSGKALHIWWYPTARDSLFYSMSILEIFMIMRDGKVYWYEALVMVVSYAGYVFYFTMNSRICAYLNISPPESEKEEEEEELEDEPAKPQIAGKASEPEPLDESEPTVKEAGTGETQDPELQASNGSPCKSASTKFGENDFGLKGKTVRNSSRTGSNGQPQLSSVFPAPPEDDSPVIANQEHRDTSKPSGGPGEEAEDGEEQEERCLKYEPIMILVDAVMPNRPERLWSLFTLCCCWIGGFTYFAVDAAGRLGCIVNMPDVVMGLVFLAAGTSVPDAMGSIAVAKDGMGDMAVANAVGSNTFDILIGLGLPWLMKSLTTQEPVLVPTESLQEAIIILAICLAGYLCIIVANQMLLTKKMGLILLSMYVVVISFLLLRHYLK